MNSLFPSDIDTAIVQSFDVATNTVVSGFTNAHDCCTNLLHRHCSAETIDTIKKASLGVCTEVATAPFVSLAMHALIDLMGSGFADSNQEALMEISNMNRAMQIKSLVEVTVWAPVAEEYFFRDLLWSFMRNRVDNPDSTTNKILRIIGTSLIFGLYHYNPLGPHDIPQCLAVAMSGCIYGALREITGDTTASIVAHGVHNAICEIIIWNKFGRVL